MALFGDGFESKRLQDFKIYKCNPPLSACEIIGSTPMYFFVVYLNFHFDNFYLNGFFLRHAELAKVF